MEFLIYSLLVYGTALFIIRTDFFTPIREFIDKRNSKVLKFLAKPLRCWFCASFWTGFIFYFVGFKFFGCPFLMVLELNYVFYNLLEK